MSYCCIDETGIRTQCFHYLSDIRVNSIALQHHFLGTLFGLFFFFLQEMESFIGQVFEQGGMVVFDGCAIERIEHFLAV